MGISLIVTKSWDRDFNDTSQSIAFDQWTAFVNQAPDVQLRTEDVDEPVHERPDDLPDIVGKSLCHRVTPSVPARSSTSSTNASPRGPGATPRGIPGEREILPGALPDPPRSRDSGCRRA